MDNPLQPSPLNARLAELADQEQCDRKVKAAAQTLLVMVLEADLDALPMRVRSARVILEAAAGLKQ